MTAQRPTYVRIAEALRGRIDSGLFGPGAKLPSEAQLAGEFGVARGTVRQALESLEDAGLVATQAGRGRFVRLPEDGRNPTAKYERVAEVLRDLIRSGQFEPGGSLPGEHAIAAQQGVSRGTARQALAELEHEGLIRTEAGRGRFVAPVAGRRVAPRTSQERVAELLRAAISDGAYRGGARLSGEQALASEYGVGRVTIRAALSQLAAEGLVEVVAGRGWFVRKMSAAAADD